ncbi:MAG: CAP domain-containing protein [Phycisphaerae bacterium]
MGTRPAWRILSLVALFAALWGGCPLEPDSGLEPAPGSGNPDLNTGGNGSSAIPGGGSSAGTGGGTRGTQDFNDQLSEQFPTCAAVVNEDAWRDEILRLVNVERTRAGLSSLEHDQTLEDQATQYACEMIHYDFFAHGNPVTGTDLSARAEQFGYEYLIIGENLAAGQTSSAQAMADWMDSEGHRENILNPDFTELGVGVRTGGRFGTYWVQEFGRPLGQ